MESREWYAAARAHAFLREKLSVSGGKLEEENRSGYLPRGFAFSGESSESVRGSWKTYADEEREARLNGRFLGARRVTLFRGESRRIAAEQTARTRNAISRKVTPLKRRLPLPRGPCISPFPGWFFPSYFPVCRRRSGRFL